MADGLKSARNVDNGKSARSHFFKNGPYGSRILKTTTSTGTPRNGFKSRPGFLKREWQFHATKGWRNYRVVK